ncbi:MAG: CPBP family intramembrane metalloprotease [Coprobacter sp.]|nr:CPBP family intramembrane metalloprotease [Coprobacter sp.]
MTRWLNRYAQSSFSVKVLVSLIVFFVFLFISSVLMAVVSLLFHSWADSVGLLRMQMFVQSLGLFVIPPFVIALLLSHNPLRFLQIDRAPLFMGVLGVFVCMMAAVPFMNWVIEWNEAMRLPEIFSGLEQWMKNNEELAQQMTDQLLDMRSVGGLLSVLLIAGVLAGLGEELTFRGVLQQLIADKCRNRHIAVWTAAFIFSAIHFQFYGFIPRLLLGAFFGYLLAGSGNLWLPVFAHFLNNSMTALISYFSEKNEDILNPYETIGTVAGGSVWAAWVSLLLFAVCCWLFRRYLFADGSKPA